MPDRPTLAVFDSKPYDRAFPRRGERGRGGADGPVFEPRHIEVALSAATAPLAAGCAAVCGFVHDKFDAAALEVLAAAAASWWRCAAPASTTSTSRRPRAWA